MALTDHNKEAVRAFYTAVSKGLPGFKSRPGQREMIACVSRSISSIEDPNPQEQDGRSICVVEGQTGTGKSIAYLVPSLVLATNLNKKLIISSATVALQEQLIDRDIPSLLQFFPDKDKIKLTIAKGRSRYACNTKLKALSGSHSSDDLFQTTWERPPRKDETETLAKLNRMLGKEWAGDRDELGFTVSDDLWHRITNDSHGCSGKNCPEHDSCSYIKSRNTIRSSNVVVMNHDFLLASIKSESKAIPELTESIVVIDEAHHLPEIVIKKFAVSHSIRSSLTWLERMGASIDKIHSLTKTFIDPAPSRHALRSLHDKLAELVASIAHSSYFDRTGVHRYPHGILDEGMQQSANAIALLSIAAVTEVDKVTNALDELRKSEKFPQDFINRIQSDFGNYISKLQNLNSTWILFAKSQGETLAKWIEQSADDFVVSASPLAAADVLTSILWSKASSVVLTSATITTLGSFKFFLDNTGLSSFPETSTLAVRSPFNFRDQGQIIIPRMKSDPKNPEDHTREIIQLLPELLGSYKGTLVLFASKKQMNAVYESMVDLGLSGNILVQGLNTKREILKIHTEKISLGLHSAIFGLASFGEGVDLSGHLCSQVIVTKIPFAPPDSPIEMAVQEWIESRGGNAFSEVSLPKAGLKLTQWVGRLIRSETDTGRIVFLDSRMYTARYKSQLLSSLPDFSVFYT